MSNFMLYCKDFEMYKSRQEWIFYDNHKKIKIIALRNENTYCWEGYITGNIDNKCLIDVINKLSHGGIINMNENELCFGFATYEDYKPRYEELGYYKKYFSEEKIENFKYWSFLEVKIELEKIASYYKIGDSISA
jgi:hypothetical protein